MTSLDDLLSRDDDDRPVGRRGGNARWVVKAVLAAATLAGAAVLALRLAGYDLPYLLAATAVLALLVLRRAVLRLGVASPGRLGEPVDPVAAAEPDGLTLAVTRWQSRLNWARGGDGRYARSVQPLLAELVDERLRQRRGFTRASDPARARALLGGKLWSDLAEPAGRTPSSRDLAAMLTTVEKL